MAENVTLGSFSTLQNSSIVSTLNANNTLIETAFADCVSLAGTSPNSMLANLDMNNNQIINLPAPSTVNSPIRVVDITADSLSGSAFGLLAGNNTWSANNIFGTIAGGVKFTDGGAASAPAININGELRIIDNVNSSYPTLFGCNHADPTKRAFAVDSDGDTFNRYYIDCNGGMVWGPGNAGQDTSLLRLGVNSLGTNGSFTLYASQSSPLSGGGAGNGLQFGSVNNFFGIFYGSGVPTLAAGKGSLYLRNDGSSGTTRMYVNSGTGISTTWVAVNTVS